MPLNPNSLLAQLSPIVPIDFGSGPRSMQRQNLELARQQFEEERRWHDEQKRLREMEANASLTAKRLEIEKDKKAAELTRQQKLDESRRQALSDFGKQALAGDPEGAEGQLPYLGSLGSGVDITYSPQGQPIYRIHEDLAKDRATEAAEADRNFDKSRTAEARPIYSDPYGNPDEEVANPTVADVTPTGTVLDLQALNDRRLARLHPVLSALGEAYPNAASRTSSMSTQRGIEGLGLPVQEAEKAYQAARSGPDAMQRSLYDIEAQREKFNIQRTELTPLDVDKLQSSGSNEAQELAKERGIDRVLTARAKAREVRQVLNDDNKENDTMIASAVMDAQGVKGTPSNTDLEFAFNVPKGSVATKLISAIEEAVNGGLSTAQRTALLKYMDVVEQTTQRNLDEYLDSAYNRLDSGEMHEEKKKGFKGRIEQSVPAYIYNDYWDRREKREADERAKNPEAASAGGGDVRAELGRQAEAAGLNGSLLGKLMRGESGGDPNAASDKSSAKGVFQVIDETARGLGYKDAAEYAAQPAAKQIEGGLKLFKAKGLTKDSPKEDYALVLAAPSLVGKWKSRDEVVYKKDSDEWKANSPWRPADGGDITIGSIADYYFGKTPTPKSDADRRVLEMLNGGR